LEEVLAKTARKKSRVTVKDMKFKNDPMIRLYEKTQDWLQERGRPLVIAVAVVAAAALLYLAGQYFLSYRASKAGVAFAEAFEKYNAQVIDSATTNQVGKFYTDERQKWQESAEAFDRLTNEYSSYYGGIGRYYAGISYLHFDPERGVQVLHEAINTNDPEVADQARLALAQYYGTKGESDKALPLYERLENSIVIPKQVVYFGLGQLYESTGDLQKAKDSYFEASKIDRETGQSSDAEKRLSALAPERIKDLPAPSSVLATP
jgi:predicted negative regulator of RcsB-dependent stress response